MGLVDQRVIAWYFKEIDFRIVYIEYFSADVNTF